MGHRRLDMRRLDREIREFRGRIRYDWEGNELVRYKDCKHASNLMPCITRSPGFPNVYCDKHKIKDENGKAVYTGLTQITYCSSCNMFEPKELCPKCGAYPHLELCDSSYEYAKY